MLYLDSAFPIIPLKATAFLLDYLITIDKIDFNPIHWIHRQDLIDYWIAHNIPFCFIKGEGRLKGYKARNVYFLTGMNPDYIYKITSNPNRFSKLDQWKKNFQTVVPPNFQYEISTIDIAYDLFNEIFKKHNQQLIIEGKQSYERIVENSSESTRYIGKHPEMFRFYDKIAEMKKKHKLQCKQSKTFSIFEDRNCSRIEVSLKGKKLPTKNLDCLETALLKPLFNPFKKVFLLDFDYNYVRPEQMCTDRDFNEYEKFIRLRTMIEEIGFMHMKNRLKKTRSYDKQFGYLINIKEKFCLGDKYHEGMESYLSGQVDA